MIPVLLMSDSPFRELPSVNDVLHSPAIQALAVDYAHSQLVAAIRHELTAVRDRLRRGESLDGTVEVQVVAARVVERLGRELQPKLRPVVNATGIVLHTNLGRAPVAEEAAKAAYEAARGYLNLELDLETGKRSSRPLAIREWLCRLTGAESATAVNNNAAATVIAVLTAADIRRGGSGCSPSRRSTQATMSSATCWGDSAPVK